MIPPPPGRTTAPRREARAGLAPTPQPPTPAGTTTGRRTRANTPGRHTDCARRQQASTNRNGMGATPSMARATSRTPALLRAQGRQRDGPRQGDPQADWLPGRTDGGNGTQAAPPPTPPPSPGMPQTRRPTPRGAHSPKTGRGETGPGCPPPKKNQPEQGTRAGSAEGHGRSGTALPAPSTGTERSARALPAGGWGGERGRRGSASAPTHKGHAGNTRSRKRAGGVSSISSIRQAVKANLPPCSSCFETLITSPVLGCVYNSANDGASVFLCSCFRTASVCGNGGAPLSPVRHRGALVNVFHFGHGDRYFVLVASGQ